MPRLHRKYWCQGNFLLRDRSNQRGSNGVKLLLPFRDARTTFGYWTFRRSPLARDSGFLRRFPEKSRELFFPRSPRTITPICFANLISFLASNGRTNLLPLRSIVCKKRTFEARFPREVPLFKRATVIVGTIGILGGRKLARIDRRAEQGF